MSQTKVKSGLLNFPDQTDFVKLPSGTTAQRPSSPEKGYSRYNTTDNKLEFWNGTIWQQLPGLVPPTIESVSYPGDDLAADPAGGQTITLTGANFLNGASVEIDGTTASVVTVVSGTEITFTAPAKAAGDYDIVLTNGDSTTATFVDGITYNGLPSWTTPAGNLGTFVAGSTIPTITLVATEPDSGAVSYSVTTGALPTGLALTGADIDGTVPTPAGQTTYNFSVTASDDENQSTERAFNIVVYLQVTNTVSEVDPFRDSSGVMLYKLDGDASDESGNYNGVASNVTWGGSGVFATSASFNGSNSVISVSKPVFLSGNPTFSVSMWIKPTNTNVFFQLGSEAIDQSFHAYTDFGALNNLRIGVWGTDYLVLLNGKMNNYLNTWFNITLTHDGSVTRGYINGALDNSASRTLSISSNNTMALGNSVALGYPWAGSIDQTRIFNKALTPLEVESLYRERVVVCGGQAATLDILGDNSCIATYQLDGNANDLSGNYSGTPTDVSYVVGEFDLAGVFNGSSSGINLPSSLNTSVIDSTGAFSISMWINANDISTIQYLFCSNPSNNVDLGINTNDQGVGKIVWTIYNTSYSYLISTTTITTNTWYNIAVTYNNGLSELFINGVSQGTITKTLLESSIEPTLGYRNTGGSVRFNGSIDQVRIFNKDLSAGEVTTLYNETACDALACGGTTNTLDILSDGSCVAAYPLDGSPLDLSGNYNGVQTNVTYPVGKFDLAAAINGVGYIQIPTLTIPNTTTISLWAKPYSATAGGTLFSAQTSDYRREYPMLIWAPASATYNGFAVIYTQNAQFITSSTVASINVWHHIVCIKNSDGSGSMYVDNALIGTIGANTTHPQIAGFTLGAKYEPENPFLGDFFPGSIDQVRIFNKALSVGEITTLYNETACN